MNFDKCRKEIIKYENKRNTLSSGIQKHPLTSKKEALDVLRCHSKKYRISSMVISYSLTFEPVCLEPFNDARECLFKLDGLMRVCEPELNLFEECVHDPVRFAKFQKLATPVQKEPKDYFSVVVRKNYF